MNEREAYIVLNMMEKVGPVGVRALISMLGCARAIFEADRDTLMEARGVGPGLTEAILSQKDSVDLKGELDRALAMRARIITQIDEEYPRQLLEIHDPPLALYVWGTLQVGDKHAIAVVGTRRPTHYGRESAGRLAFELARSGFVIVSGLAHGIDTAAHEGALSAKGRTLAVLGSGLDCVYPASNAGLARDIRGHGAVITEFAFGRRPDRSAFPMRNRLVSGLSMGVLVVEAGRRSGALITARQALEQGRSVFAVPGRIDSHASRGTHDLIRNGARLVEDTDDILDEYDFLAPPAGRSRPDESALRPGLSSDESRLLELLEPGERDVDGLIRASGLGPAAVSSLLIGLEMKKVVRMLPGRIVERRG